MQNSIAAHFNIPASYFRREEKYLTVQRSAVNVIFDFDHTLLPEESIVEILKLSFQSRSNRDFLLSKLACTAPRALAGVATFKELFFLYRMTTRIRQSRIQQYILSRAHALDPKMAQLIYQLKEDGVHIFILSGSYEELIKPLAAQWGIKPENVIANRFYWWGKRIIGVRRSPFLSASRSRPVVVNTLNSQYRLLGPTVLVGDGQVDRAVWHCGLVECVAQDEYYVNANLNIGNNRAHVSRIENMYMLITKLLATAPQPTTT